MGTRHLLVIGSRPEAIKMAPVIFALREHPANEVVVCSTGQQREMIPQALAEFGVTPDLNLDVMQSDQTLAGLTARLLTALDEAMTFEAPDRVVVQGDTTSAMAGALSAFYRRVPVGHVEAGMRTREIYSPFPEEVNRRVISQCATWHFAATEGSRRNLLREGVPAERISVTGNTVVDALLWTRQRIREQEHSHLPARLLSELDGRRLVLITTHRRESFGRPLHEICEAVRELVRQRRDLVVAIPVHPNPSVASTIDTVLGSTPGVVLISPQPYRAFVELLDRCALLLTDSGGLQEEAPFLGKPTLVLRDTTERPEGIDAGCARLVGTDRSRIVETALDVLDNPETYRRMTCAPSLYGDGRAAERIASALAGTASEVPPDMVALETPLAPVGDVDSLGRRRLTR